MWKQLLDFGRRIVSLSTRVDRVEEEAKSLRQTAQRMERELIELNRKFDALLAVVQHLNARIDHERENAQRDREILALRLDNELLRFQRRLASGDQGDKPPEQQ